MKCIHRVLYVTSIEIYEIYQTRRQSQIKSVSIDRRWWKQGSEREKTKSDRKCKTGHGRSQQFHSYFMKDLPKMPAAAKHKGSFQNNIWVSKCTNPWSLASNIFKGFTLALYPPTHARILQDQKLDDIMDCIDLMIHESKTNPKCKLWNRNLCLEWLEHLVSDNEINLMSSASPLRLCDDSFCLCISLHIFAYLCISLHPVFDDFWPWKGMPAVMLQDSPGVLPSSH